VVEQAVEVAPVPASPAEALAAVTVHPEGSEAASESRLSEARARDEKGRFAAQKEARETAEKRGEEMLKKEFPDLAGVKGGGDEEQPEVKAKADANGAKSSEQKEAAAVPTERQLGRADAILKRAGISQARIDKMQPDEKMDLAKELKPTVIAWQQAEQRKSDPGFAAETIAKTPKAGSPAGEPPDSPLDALAEAVKDAEREYGPEAAATLEKFFRAASAPILSQLEAAKAEQAKRQEADMRATIDTAREALVDRFPELEDQEVFDEDVLPFMVGLAHTGRFNLTDKAQVKKLLTQAAVAAELSEVKPQAKAEDEQVARLTRNGTASSRSRVSPYTGKTKDERINLAGKLAQDMTISVEEARRRVHGS
jgi:hypothetical protein